MNTLRKSILAAGVLLAGLPAAQAQEGTQYNVAIVSNYMFRGISQTDNHAALQGGIDYRDAGGLYAGVWGTTHDIPNTRAHVRVDGYAGFAYETPRGPGFDVGVRAYSNGFVRAQQERDFFWELLATFKFGPAKLGLAHDFDNEDTYAMAGLQYDLGSGTMLNMHVGHYFIKAPDLGDDYTDFSIGISKMFNSLEASLTVTDSNQDPESNLNDLTLILSGKYLF